MEDIEQIKRNIEKYISSSEKYNKKKDNIDIEIKKIGGLSNLNYMGIIKDSSSNEILELYFIDNTVVNLDVFLIQLIMNRNQK